MYTYPHCHGFVTTEYNLSAYTYLFQRSKKQKFPKLKQIHFRLNIIPAKTVLVKHQKGLE